MDDETVMVVRVYGEGEQLGRRVVSVADFFTGSDVNDWWDEAEKDYVEMHGDWAGRKNGKTAAGHTRT